MLQLKDKRYEQVRLIFQEEGHKYTDTFGNSYKSTTTLLHDYQEQFDKTYWLKKKSKELNISETRLSKQWDTIKDEACERGTNTHDHLESGIKENSKFQQAIKYISYSDGSMITVADIPNININIKQLDVKAFIDFTENKYPEIYNVFKYYTDNGYKIYAEIGVFLIDFLTSGCIDILCIREDQFVIGDWKTNRGGLKFESGYYKKDKTCSPIQETDIWVPKKEFLLPPVNNLPNCNGSMYKLQLSKYAFSVETVLGIPCAGLWLAHIDSDFVLNKYGRPKRFSDGLYHIKDNPKEKVTLHKMQYCRDEIVRILSDRHKDIQATRIMGKTLFD